jgi:ribosomal protein L19E
MLHITHQDFSAVWQSLLEDGTFARMDEAKKRRERIRRMKHEFLRLQKKNRLLKRKIRDFYKQGEGNGKSKDLG